jgi:hypothetical protein
MTRKEVNAAIRDSLGLPAKPEPQPTFPQEGHVSEFPYWSFSKKRSSVTRLDITYEDNSFMTLLAPLGMPSPSFAGYLDAILFYGQRDLFIREYVEISVYKILKTLEIDPENGRAYAHFHRDMERAFMAAIKTDASVIRRLVSVIRSATFGFSGVWNWPNGGRALASFILMISSWPVYGVAISNAWTSIFASLLTNRGKPWHGFCMAICLSVLAKNPSINAVSLAQ